MDRSTASRARLSSSLGKRGAAEAGMDGTLRRYHELESRYATLERRLLDSQRTEHRLSEENEELLEQLNELKQNRTNWLDSTKSQRSQADQDTKAWEAERAGYQQELRELRTRSNRTRDENEMLKSECASLSARLSQVEGQTAGELASLKGRLAEVEGERDELKEWRRRAANLSLQLEEAKRRSQAAGSEDKDVGVEVDQDLRKTLSQQKEKLSLFSSQLDSTRSELVTLRREKQEWLESRKQQTETESRLRNEVQVLHGQLERARRDMDSLTLSFPSSSDNAESGSDLQAKLTSLSALHHQATADIAARDTEINQLRSSHADYVTTSRITVSDLTKQNTNLSRELRWATQGRIEAERREQLAKKELEAYEGGSSSHGMPGGLSSSSSAASSARLQALVDEYKSELDRVARDSRDLEAQLAEGAGLVKSSLLDEAQSRITTLDNDIANLQSTITQLTAANTTLDAEVNDLMRRVASGEYNTQTERVLELKQNPASKVMAVRAQQLADLRAENEALLRAAKGSAAGDGEGAVPRESWARLVREKEEMEQAHQKRLQRLKEIFGNKSKEFLEAVYSLLGWRIKFDESGADVRLTSMYAPKGKMGLTIKFNSQEGHFGTMQMTGGMSKGLEESRHFWVVERQSVPGFLAQVTTEMFEKTTMGQKAGYVGWE